MDHKVEFPKLLNEAVVEAFGSVFALPALADKDPELYGMEGIFSTIYLKGDVVGKVSFFMRGSWAAIVVGSMLGIDDLDEEAFETLDGVGEILNMITGGFKRRLEPHKMSVEISIPSTRMTGSIPPSRWEDTVELGFQSKQVFFKVILSYRIATKEDKASQEPPPKPKLTAADLLKMAMAKKKPAA